MRDDPFRTVLVRSTRPAVPGRPTGSETLAAAGTSETTDGSIKDADMGRAIAKGSAVGIPLVFGIIFLIDLFAGLSVPLAALGASIPGVIFGAFIGSAYYIGKASDAAQAQHGTH